MINFIKKNYYYLILFVFIFLVYSVFIFSHNYCDPLTNYGFSYAITKGLLPYVDFNTISTPLYAFIMSLGLLLWNNYSMFLLEQSLLVTVMFYLLEKLYGKKAFILLFVISALLFFGINATYNFLAFFFIVVLLFLEKKYKDKDYLIGVVIGLVLLSKHTVGCLLVLPSLIYYFKNKNKLFKRFFGLLCVCLIFVLYLLLTNSFMKFIDLCFLGLLDFSAKNGNSFNFFFYLSIILFIISIIITIKRKSDISNYYLLLGISFVIPLFDLCHFSIYMMCITLQVLPFIKKYEDYLGFLGYILSIVVAITLYLELCSKFVPVLNKDIKHFEYLYNDKNDYEITLKSFELFDMYNNPIILSYSKMEYDISRDKNIDYYDVLLYGNFGYNGSNKMIDKIKKTHNTYIIIDLRGYLDKSSDSQFDKSIVEYVIDNCELKEKKDYFLIYYKG